MVRYDTFFREFIVRRKSDLNRIIRLSALKGLPIGSVLHTAENLDSSALEVNLSPNASNPLLKLAPDRKVLFFPSHDTVGPWLFPEPEFKGMILRSTGHTARISDFRRANQRTVKVVADPSELPNVPSMQAWVNYNSLFHMTITGKHKTYRVFSYVMSCILNMCCKLKDRQHFIQMPISNKTFSRNEMARMYANMSQLQKLTHPTSIHYIFELQMLAFVKGLDSLFSSIPKDLLDNINLIVSKADMTGRTEAEADATFFFCYNLGKLVSITQDLKTADLILLNHFNTLASFSTAVLESADPNATEFVTKEEDFELPDEIEQLDVLEDKQETKEHKEQASEVVAETAENVSSNPKVIKAIKEYKKTKDVTKLNAIKKDVKDVVEQNHHEHTVVSGYRGQVTETQEQRRARLKAERKKKDAEIEQKIDENDSLTIPQKRRVISKSQTYKTLVFTDGAGKETNMQEVLDTPSQMPLERRRLDHLEDLVIDQSILYNSTLEMDKQYIAKGLQPDMMRVLTSFPNMHLVDISIDRVDDSVNRMDHYVVKYEDNNLKTHTVRFSMPVPDEQGNLLVNGVEKKMFKQRINIPICQISEYQVSLSSNYCKTLVERPSTVAHSFAPKVGKILDKGGFAVLKISSYPFALESNITFPEAEKLELRERWRDSKKIFTVRVSKEYDKWIDDLSPMYVASNAGNLMVLRKTPITSIKQYEFYKDLPAEVVKELSTYDKLLVLELMPVDDTKLSYEYTTLARSMETVSKAGLHLTFSYLNRYDRLGVKFVDRMIDLESEFGVYFGIDTDRKEVYFISLDGIVSVIDATSFTKIRTTTIIDILVTASGTTITPLNEWASVRVGNNEIPVISVLCYQHGFLKMLDYTNTNYVLVDAREVKQFAVYSSIVLKFADKVLVIPKPTTMDRLLYSGFNYFNVLGKHHMEEMEAKETFLHLFDGNDLSPRNITAMENFYELFIDPITKGLLEELSEPTNMKDLLLRAVQMLTTEYCIETCSSTNTMIRSYQRFPAVVYKELSKAYTDYKRGGRMSNFSINPFTISQTVLSDQLMRNTNSINPVQIIKDECTVSHMGFGGRTADRFTVPDRRYASDNLGIMSEATTDDCNAGVSAGLTMDAHINTLSGLGTPVDPEHIEPAQMLSPTALVFPGTTYDDGKRANYTGIQMSHVVPTAEADVYPIGTGFETVVSQYSSPPYTFVAEHDGKITKYDTQIGMVEVTYKDGSIKVFHIGREMSKNPGGGFNIEQVMIANDLEEGKAFKAGDVLAYNDKFFKPIHGTKQVKFALGVTANVAFIDDDLTHEDSTYITEALARRLDFTSIFLREIVITKATTIHQYAKIGDSLKSTDPLMIFDESAMPDMTDENDPVLQEMLTNLNKAIPKAKYDGEVLRVEIYHTMPISEMSPSVAKMIEVLRKDDRQRANFSKDAGNSKKFQSPGALKESKRIGIVDLDEDTIVLRYYISSPTGMGGGDKLIVSSSLKSVNGGVFKRIGNSGSGIEIDIMSSWEGVNKRIVYGVLLTGCASRVLRALNEAVIAIADE